MDAPPSSVGVKTCVPPTGMTAELGSSTKRRISAVLARVTALLTSVMVSANALSGMPEMHISMDKNNAVAFRRIDFMICFLLSSHFFPCTSVWFTRPRRR